MNRLFCDRCGREIKKETAGEQLKLEHLWTSSENKENEFWDICRDCFKELKLFLRGAWKGPK